MPRGRGRREHGLPTLEPGRCVLTPSPNSAAVRIGTAAWSLPRPLAGQFPGEGHQLQRYARVLRCTEINSSFYRSHRAEVYARWAALTPEDFRFSVKLPRSITHEARLRGSRPLLRRFLAEVAGLGLRLGVILVQLPPSLVFEPRQLRRFAEVLAEEGCAAPVALEPRHPSWFTPAAQRALMAARISRVAADPALGPAAQQPGGWLGGVRYHRWHGSPRMYWSSYTPAWLRAQAEAMRAQVPAQIERWCIFDNTAAGCALANALELQGLVDGRP